MSRKELGKPEKSDLTAMLEFSETGYLKKIYLCASNVRAQEVLAKAIQRLIKPEQWRWLRRLFLQD